MFRPSTDSYTHSRAWLSSPRARALVDREQRLLRSLLPELVGYRCVQVGVWGLDAATLAHAGTLCQWRLGFGRAGGGEVAFDGRHLPLASASVDAIVIAHALEQVAEPQGLLRECARVLNDRGQLVVLAFNPLSPWSLWQMLPARRTARFVPCATPPSAGRLCDWLRLLDFKPHQLWRYGTGVPFLRAAYPVGHGARWARLVAWSAQAYAVVARRQTLARTPPEGHRRRARRARAPALARGASRDVSCRR